MRLPLGGGGGERRNFGGGDRLGNKGEGTGDKGEGEGTGEGGGGLGSVGGGTGEGGDGGIAARTELIQSLYAVTLINTVRMYVPHGELASGSTPYDTVPNISGGDTSTLYKGPPLSP